MKFKKSISLLLSAVMLMGSASFAASAASTDEESVSGSYYNSSYLENYANKAYNESNLGSTYSAASTTWKTWSPDASSVKVKLYRTGSDSESGAGVIGEYALTKNSTTGVWSTTLTGDYKNVYYTYLVTVNSKTNETQDVYSKAVGVNGNRSMVVDLDSTDPDGWNSDSHVLFNNAAEAVVWEVHVRDFSASSTSGVSEENQGKYLAFAEGGTKLNSDTSSSAVSTGIDYLVEQGINCVQLMPVYDFQSVDEAAGGSSSNRNWGYDPQNYNAPEGSYSSNPYDGNTRITEFKQMIQALHDRGISVVMDVVYNHTYATEGSCFSKTVPGYYYRMTSSSTYSNGSGCGNETASDKLMYRKYMIDSIKYWADEYHIDGFRFDLMGIHDVTTMNDIRSALDGLYSDGSGKKILMYGEPWTGGTTAISDGCSQSRASSLDSRVGMFCDSYRDAIKGGTDDATTGFIQGNTDKTYNVVQGVQGKGFGAKAPSQTIAYADAHDNLILWDKILKSNYSSDYSSTSESFKGQMKEAMTLLMTSQGIPFMTAGSEFCRTKQGDHNSYKSSDAINAIDWTRVKKYSDIVAYYKGLLAIRENYTPMHSGSFNTPSFQSNYGYVVAYTYSNNKSDEWGNVCVLVNGGSQAYSITLNGSSWTVVANQNSAGLKSLGTVSGNSYSIPAKSAAVLVQSSTFSRLNVKTDNFGTLTVKHVDENGNVLKTSTAKYRDGSTYRSLPDSTILFDHELIGTDGATSGKVVGGNNYTVTYKYKSDGIQSGHLKVNYVDSNGKSLKDQDSQRLKAGESYDVAAPAIQGYQLDTDKYPAMTKGTFSGSDTTITFTYKALDSASTKVHYYNSNNWSSIRCYAYTDDGKQPCGTWYNATIMTSEGNNWYVCNVPASCAYVMFHPTSGSAQDPGQGESGYLVSGEGWIQNKTASFNTKIVTSHIDIKTGKKIATDVVDNKSKVTASDSYTTSAVSGRTDVITPANATGNCSAGVINVIYLYNGGSQPDTQPTTSVQPTTATQPTTVTPTTEPTTVPPTTAPPKYYYGDVNLDGKIDITDSTAIQMYLDSSISLNELQMALANVGGEGVNIKSATYIQKYIASYGDAGKTGEPYYGQETTTVVPTVPEPTETTQPTTSVTPSDKITVYYENSGNWSSVKAYYWSDSDTKMTTWPGESMTNVSGNVYKIEIPSNATNIIFTDGVSQTDDIALQGGNKIYKNGSWSNYSEAPNPTTPPVDPTDPASTDKYTITFTNNMNWSAVNCYYWSTSDKSMVAWPGNAMTYSTTNDYGQKIYTIEIPSTADHIIFNNGGQSQTVDISVTGSAKYYISGGSGNAYTVATWQ